MKLSIGILYDLQELIVYLKEIKTDIYISDIPYLVTNLEINKIISMASRMNIASIYENKITLNLSYRDQLNNKSELQNLLREYILTYRPPWSQFIPRGRKVLKCNVEPNINQCFESLNLYDNNSDECVNWWDQLSSGVRIGYQTKKLQIGRKGERATLEFEKNRTKKNPNWVSIESNDQGYDILSIIDQNNSTPMAIEVKTSNNRLEYAKFHITKNEWEKTASLHNYKFYLWHFDRLPSLCIIDKNDIKTFIPNLNQPVNWVTLCFNFNYFFKKFPVKTINSM